jgi:hypothetical protein
MEVSIALVSDAMIDDLLFLLFLENEMITNVSTINPEIIIIAVFMMLKEVCQNNAQRAGIGDARAIYNFQPERPIEKLKPKINTKGRYLFVCWNCC